MALLIGLAIGVVAITLGIQGFLPAGIPLTSAKRLTGGVAKGIGIACIVVGLLFIAASLYPLLIIARR